METVVQNVDQVYYDYLKEEGYLPKRYDDGDIGFKYEGNTYIIHIDNYDKEFFCMSLIYGYKCKNDDDKIKAYKVASETTKRHKMVKTNIIEKDESDDIIIITTVECLLNIWMDFKINLRRWIRAMDRATYYFVKNMIEEDDHEF